MPVALQAADSLSQHITGYPVVNDVITNFKKNPYGQKSIELSDSAYKTFAAPFMPYLEKPYQYVSPYVQKADKFGDGALTQFDERVPVLKKPTDQLYSETKQIVFFPIVKGKETADHVISIYNSEYKKIGGDNVVTSGKAAITTSLAVTVEALNWVSEWFRTGKEKVKEATAQANNRVSERVNSRANANSNNSNNSH
jgi:hypothetical protein